MKLIRLIMLTFTSMLLINCGGTSSKDQAISTNGQALRGTPLLNAKSTDEIEALSPSNVLRGRIYRDDNWSADTQIDFQRHIVNFLSPQLTKSEIGTVNGEVTESETGIDFWGRGFKLKNGGGAFDPSKPLKPGRDILDTNSAELRLNVYQKLNGQLQEVPIHFNSISANKNLNEGQLVDSQVQVDANGQALIQLIFADSLGKLQLTGHIYPAAKNTDGSIKPSSFEGQVMFQNLKVKNGTGLINATNQNAEVLGKFVVHTCGFFTCSH